MNIGIFSKFEMCGGSEFRGCELANGIAKYTEHDVTILTRGSRIPDRLVKYLDPRVAVVREALTQPQEFYSKDCVLVINTDSKEFTTLDFWNGKSPHGADKIDLTQIKKMVFLFNFIVSPSRHLAAIKQSVPSVGVITTNSKFFEEITKQDRYEHIRLLPRMRLESPIDPESVPWQKTPSDILRIGMHSKGLGNKWNEDIAHVIKKLGSRYPHDNPFHFKFMGINNSHVKTLGSIGNVRLMRENEVSVSEFLGDTDIFMFFPSWKREEPWARVVGEAMMSGCPILATDKGGNKDQVINHHNGFLCRRKDDFFKHLCYLNEHRDIISKMSNNSHRLAMSNFQTKVIVNRLVEFMERM